MIRRRRIPDWRLLIPIPDGSADFFRFLRFFRTCTREGDETAIASHTTCRMWLLASHTTCSGFLQEKNVGTPTLASSCGRRSIAAGVSLSQSCPSTLGCGRRDAAEPIGPNLGAGQMYASAHTTGVREDMGAAGRRAAPTSRLFASSIPRPYPAGPMPSTANLVQRDEGGRVWHSLMIAAAGARPAILAGG